MARRPDRPSHRGEPPYGRRPPLVDAGRRLLAICGGERTENEYLKGLARQVGFRGLRVVPQKKGKGKDPADVVNQALQRSSTGKPFDEVWCVLDKDDFGLAAAIKRSSQTGIRLAVSNPSFELWLLLHLKDCGAELTQAEALERLRKCLPNYDKARLKFDDFASRVDEAIRRGRRLSDTTGLGPNPSSGMWKLAETIMGEVRK